MADWLNERAAAVRASIAVIRELDDQLSHLQLGWKPPDGGWSIAQVFEHLILTDSSYLEPLRHMIETGVRGDRPYKPTLAGGLLIRSLLPTSTRRVTTPSVWQPAPEARANVVKEYLSVREELASLIERARGVDLRHNRMRSPASKWVRLNLGDAITVLVVHTQRHLQQVERVRARPGFPRT